MKTSKQTILAAMKPMRIIKGSKGKHLAAAICLSLAFNAAALTPVLALDVIYTGDQEELKTIIIGSAYHNSVFPGTEAEPSATENNVVVNVSVTMQLISLDWLICVMWRLSL